MSVSNGLSIRGKVEVSSTSLQFLVLGAFLVLLPPISNVDLLDAFLLRVDNWLAEYTTSKAGLLHLTRQVISHLI